MIYWLIKSLPILLFMLGSMGNTDAQDMCGMHVSDDAVLGVARERQMRKEMISTLRSDEVDEGQMIYIPVTAHIIRDNAGEQGYSEGDLYPLMCELNQFFRPINMYFYLKGDVQYVNDQSLFWTYNASNNALFDMIRRHMDASYVDSTLNLYFCNFFPNANGANLLGAAPFPSMDVTFFNSRPAGVVMNKTASQPGNRTLPHELGHHFNLLHTFQGSNSTSSQFREYVSREEGLRNCATAGDLFCDTPADTLAYGCPYSGSARDLRGEPLVPDESLFMSYYSDNCMNRFSNEEMDEMRQTAFFNPQRNRYRQFGGTPNLNPVNSLDIAQIAPANGASVPYNFVNFSWRAIPGANKYLVVINDAGNGAKVAELALKDTSIVYSFPSTSAIGRRYNWSVKAYREGNMCSNYIFFRSFTAGAATSIAQNFLDATTLELFPNPLIGGVPFRLAFIAGKDAEIVLTITDMSGRSLYRQELPIRSGGNQFMIPVEGYSNGMYLVSLQDESGVITKKLVIQR
jgi:hypothetical protein